MSSTNRGSKRPASDYYPTPYKAFVGLLEHLPKPPIKIWEPAKGKEERLVNIARDYGLDIDGDDIETSGYDYLKDYTYRECVVTNPPFSLAKEFCDHAIKHSKETFMLLRLNFLGSVQRRIWWKTNEPAAIFVITPRPSFTGGGTDSCEYGWFYWGTIARRGIYHL